VRIVALLSWFDEYPSWLAATVASAARVADHVVAVDGAYALMARGAASSGVDQQTAIVDAAEAAGVGLTLHVPGEKWVGEVEKRAFLFEAGRLVARTVADWFLVIDADEIVVRVPLDLRERLAGAEEDVAAYGLVTHWEDHPDAERLGFAPMPTRNVHPVRGLYRNIPGLTVRGTHYGYVADDHSDLWLGAPALDLTDLVVDHRAYRRDDARRARQEAYYRTRDLAGIEREEAVHA
jgi:hypothetical protein